MDSIPHGLQAALVGLIAGVVLGLSARLGNFCTLGALETAAYGGDQRRCVGRLPCIPEPFGPYERVVRQLPLTQHGGKIRFAHRPDRLALRRIIPNLQASASPATQCNA